MSSPSNESMVAWADLATRLKSELASDRDVRLSADSAKEVRRCQLEDTLSHARG